jgi:transposase
MLGGSAHGAAAGRPREALEADLAHWYTYGPFAHAVARLAAYRGVARLGALTIASEVGDWRRFPPRRTFMGFTGLVPSEYSSGESVHRGRITKAGNAHLRTQLIESARAYQHRASLGTVLRRRQDGVNPATAARSWAAQQRLCSRFRRLSSRKTSRNIVVVAIARELAGFCWAEMTTAS